jgi:hypothetical protein
METKEDVTAGKTRRIIVRLTALAKYVQDHQLGEVYARDGFKLRSKPIPCWPQTSLCSKERLEKLGETESYWPQHPILRRGKQSVNTVREVKKSHGMVGSVRLVWVLVQTAHVTVYRSLTDIVALTENDTLDGGDVVPGFQIAVAEILPSSHIS